METIIIEKSSKSPAISLNANDGLIEISGRSVIENTKKFHFEKSQ